MERLIVEDEDIFWIKGHTADSCLDICDEIHGECWHCAIMSCMEKLAVYEEAEEEGRLIWKD